MIVFAVVLAEIRTGCNRLLLAVYESDRRITVSHPGQNARRSIVTILHIVDDTRVVFERDGTPGTVHHIAHHFASAWISGRTRGTIEIVSVADGICNCGCA